MSTGGDTTRAVEPPAARLDRPLRLGEVLTETARLYGERPWASLGLGAVVAGSLLVARELHAVVAVALVAIVFTTVYAAAARLVSGDSFGGGWSRAGRRLPVLLVLAFVVGVPFTLGRIDPILLVLAVAWLATSGFAIPISVVEAEAQAGGPFGGITYALARSFALARTEFLHAMGIAAALVILYLVAGLLLTQALVGFADNTREAALALVELVLAPFFFLGLAVLYFEQRARFERE